MAQFLRPDANISATNWTGSYTAIDEASYDDGDYLTGSSSGNGTVEVGLSNGTDPESSSGHTIRFRAWQQNNTKQRTLGVKLMQGATQISVYNAGNLVKGTQTAYEWTLSAAVADSITDYTDLRLQFISGGDVGTPSAQRSAVYVSWAEKEIPDAEEALTADLAGTLTTAGSVARQGAKPLAGALSSAGALWNRAAKSLSGALGASGALLTVKTALLSLAGTLTTAGAVAGRAAKPLAGVLGSAGSLALQTARGLAGELTSAGALWNRAAKTLAGTVGSSGAVSTVKAAMVALGGTLSSAGAVALQAVKGLAGSVSAAGMVDRKSVV